MCQQLRSVVPSASVVTCPRSSRRQSVNTLNGMGFIRRTLRTGGTATFISNRRQAGCMAKTEKRRKTRLPKQVTLAIRAASDKQAADMTVLDLRKGDFGFFDYTGKKVKGGGRLECQMTIKGGRIMYDLNGIARPAVLPRPGRRVPVAAPGRTGL